MEKELMSLNSEISNMLVKDFFISFMDSMNEWENSFNASNINQEALKEQLLKIFDFYCSKKERKNARPNILYSEDPPEYDTKHNVIEKIEQEKNKFILYTQQTNKFHNKYRYFIVLKNNALKIDKKERWSSFEQKWIKYNL